MLTNALGEIEVLGLPAAIEAADVAVKSADVRLIGYETTDGAGMVTVKVEGQVSAVQSAIAAARTSAERVSRVFAVSVIPRPSAQLDDVVLSPATVGPGAPARAGRAVEKAAAENPRPVEGPAETGAGTAPGTEAAARTGDTGKRAPAKSRAVGAGAASPGGSPVRKTSSAGGDGPQAEKK
ncbi:BMC domain-containing protein [uncultured Propionibacterium sp.]|uniref:BMC domain-containing protein n=1 Tax=uncultured Propionibacterium sp. TaxID=218066 RepID=UPI00292EC055|nr:BMC domain-containing protein [uncultured Propionibacterium sp.]